MAAVISSNTLGVLNSSLDVLGSQGALGQAAQGHSGERVYVNAATGNLVVQDTDEVLLGRGLDVNLLRTYNSQGLLSDDNGDSWRMGVYRKVSNLAGTVNSAGSTVTRVASDGSESTYTYDAVSGVYVSTDGAGSYNTLAYDAATQTWTFSDGETQVQEFYDAANGGRLVKSQDPDGSALTYVYNATGLITQVNDASGETTYLDYAGTLLTDLRTVESDGTALTRVRYSYDDSSRLSQVTVDLTPDDNSVADNNEYVTTYTYVDATSTRLASMSQSDGTSLSFGWTQINGTWMLQSVTDTLGQITSFSYADGQTTITDPLQQNTVITFDALGELSSVTAPAVGGTNQVLSYAYDGSGNLQQLTDARGNVTAYQYDAHGNLTLQRDAAGNTVTRTYGANNQLLTETVYLVPDPDGAGPGQPSGALTTRYVYDANNHLRFVVSAEGRVTEYRYDGFGEQVAAIQYTGSAYSLTGLNPTDALTEAQLSAWASATDKSKTLRTDTSYDFRGQVASTTSYASVDAAGNGVADGTQSVRQYVYDQAGNLLKTVDARGVATGDPTKYTTSYAYDGLGRLLATTDALGRATLTQYDDANRKVVLTLANGLISTSTYDAAGRLVSLLQSADGQVLGTINYFYDADGRLRRTVDPAGISTQVLYDEAGRKVATIDGTGSLTEYVYDADNEVTKTIQYATAVSAVNLASLVDAQGNPTGVTLDAIRPAASANDRITWNAYDSANRLVKSVDEQGYVTQYFYDGASRVTGVLHYATAIATAALSSTPAPSDINPASSADDRLTRNFYDGQGKLAGTLDGEGYLVEYKYDAGGQLTETVGYAQATDPSQRTSSTLAQLRPATSVSDIHSHTLYNARGQVAGTIDGEGYLTETVYDLAGNKTQVIRYATPVAYTPGASLASVRPASSPQDRVSSYTYTALNQLSNATDFEGTLTQYTYDEVGNLTTSVSAVNTADVRTLSTRYDKQGRVIAELSGNGAAQLTGGQTQAQIDAIWASYAIQYSYDADGRRTSATDADGHKTLYYYDADGRLTHTINAAGEVTQSAYNTLGELVQTIVYGTRLTAATLGTLTGGLVNTTLTSAITGIANAGLDSVTSYAYTTRGQVASTADALGFVTTRGYDAFGDLTASSQAIGGGQTLDHTYRYDHRGLLTQTAWDPTGLDTTASTQYDAFGRAIQTTDARGTITSYSYDRLGHEVTTTLDASGLGISRSATYDAFGRVLTQTDALGNQTSYAYDNAARSITVTTPEGIVTSTVHNRNGQTQSITDGRGTVTSYSYDKDGNLTDAVQDSGTGRLNLDTHRDYDAADLLIDTIDANGVKTSYSYDAANRVLTRRVDPNGLNLTTSYGYDAKGQTVSVTDANNVVTQTQFDLKGEVVRVIIDPSGLNIRTAFTYDSRGKTLTVTEGEGSGNPRLTQYKYDKLGRRIEEHVDPNGLNLTTLYGYDQNGNVVGKTDALGNVTRYAYDTADRLVYTVDALGGVTKNEYDGEGRVTKTIAYATPLTNLSTLPSVPSTADVASRLSASSADETRYHVYDKNGREVYTIDALGAVTQRVYDASGNVTQRTTYATSITVPAMVNPANVAAAVALVQNATLDRTTRTVYDAANRAAFTIDAAGYVTQSVYDGDGNMIKQIAYSNPLQGNLLPNAAPQVVATAPGSGAFVISDSARDEVSYLFYDAAGRLRYGVNAESYVTERRYDALGHEIQRIRYAGRFSVGVGTTEANMEQSFSSTPPATAVVEGAQYDGAGRLVQTVDGAGNVTRNAYDALGHKTDVTVAYRTGDASTTHYTYDSAGREIQEIHAFGTPVAATTRYVLDAVGHRLQTIDPRGVELAESDSEWALATRAALGYVDASGNAQLAGALSSADKNSFLARYTTLQQFDALGRTASTTDALGGVTTNVYDAFGNVIEVIDPRRNAGYFYFDQRNQAVLHVDPEGYATQSAYDAFGNVATTVRYANRVTGTVSTGTPPAIVASAPASGPYVLVDSVHDQTTAVQFDTRNEETKVTDAEGYFEQYSYDAFGKKVTSSNKLGGVTTNTYDRVGNLTSETLPITSVNAAGQSVPVVNHYEYDARGNRTKQIEAYGLPEQLVTQYVYDHLDRQVQTVGEAVHVFDTTTLGVTGTASPTEQKKYDDRGNLIETDAANGARTLTYYDALDRKIAQVDALGALTVWQYNEGTTPIAELQYGDAVALPAAAGGTPPAPVNAANVRVKYFTYDANNALVQTVIPAMTLGEQAIGASAYASFTQDIVTKSIYDADGNEVQQIDARGHSTFRYYDRLGNKILEVDPLGYVTRWEYDASGNVIRETQYANSLSITPTVASDVSGLLANIVASGDDRVTELDYDRMGRVIEKRTLNVAYGAIAANGNLTSATDVARTQTQYNGLGQVIRQIDATGTATDYLYDLQGRKIEEQDPQFTDYQGDSVRPTTDYEYDGLNQIRREIARGKDNSTEADDRITTYRYDYGYGARLIAQTDATGATTSFFYDVSGDIVHKTLLRQDADGNTTLDRSSYTYDALAREIENTDLGTGQANETRYDLYGEITGKRTNGGGVGGLWQETTEYDQAGRVWKTNSGDGVYKAYLYDANGNATLEIQSAGPDLSTLTFAQVMALPGNQTYLTISQYDARNKLVGTFQPQMNTSHDQAAIEQFITQQTGTQFSAGSVAVGSIESSNAKPQTDPVATGSSAIMRSGTASGTLQLIYYENVVQPIHSSPGVQIGSSSSPTHSFSLGLPDTSALGSGNIRVSFNLAGLTGSSPLNGTLSGYGTSFYVPNGQLSTSFTFTESGYLSGPEVPNGKGQYVIPPQANAVFYNRSYSYAIYKETPFGEIYLGAYSGATPNGGALFHQGQSTNVWYTVGTSTAIGSNEVDFQGQSQSANRLILQYRSSNTSSGWSTLSVPSKVINGSAVAGWFAFDWSSWTRGSYDIRYTTLDASGNVLNSESGTMVLSDSSPSITQAPQKIGGAGRAFLGADGKLNILEQRASAQTLTVRYRHTGSSEAWTTVTLNPASIGGASTPGWFVLDPTANGMSGAYDYWIEAKDASGNQVNKALGSFTVGNANSVAAPTAYQDLPEMVHFLSQPVSAASMKLMYRPSGSTGAYTTVWLSQVGTGAFDWDATSLVTDRLSNYGYEYQYETYDAANVLVNKAHGVLQLGANPAMLSHINDSTPTLVTFNPPQTNAATLVLQYRNSGSTGAYTSVTLTRSSGASPFTWDASAVVPPGTTANLDYFYDLYDAANAAVLSAEGTPVHVAGALSIGAASAPTQLNWVIVGSSNEQWSIHRQQTYDAFGDVVQEIDGLGHITNFSYNSLGLLVEKRDPETNVTLANGFIQRARPTTTYTYDLGGRLVAVKDADGNLNTQQLLAGTGGNGSDALITTEFHADGGQKRTSYDVFGDARVLTDEIGQVTQQEFDRLGRLVEVIHPARAAYTPGNETAAAVAAIDLYAYDQAGNRISHTNAANATEKTYYDSLGRVLRTTTFGGNATSYGYSYDNTTVGLGGKQVGGWVKTTTDATGHTMQDTQELFGRVVLHKDLGDHVFSYVYNYAGWLTSQTGSTGQNIVYDYYANGYLKSINDLATGSFTKYEYDAEGNRTLEAYTQNLPGGGVAYYEYAQVSYDELNRVTEVLDPKADILYEYDANGNRRRVWSYYHDGVNGSPQIQDYWYLYDSMNRFTTTMGQLSSGGARGVSATDTSVSIVVGNTGVQVNYDAASERRTAIYGVDGHREDYTYTADGYLEDTSINNVVRAQRFNDILGRVTQYQEYDASGVPSFSRVSSYNADDQLLSQQEYKGAIGSVLSSSTSYDYIDAPGTNNNAGPLALTVATQYDTGSGGGNTTVYSYYGYQWWDSAKQSTITAQPINENAPNWLPGYSNFEYDVNGHLKQVDDPMGGRAIRYVTDAQGQVLVRDDISGGTANAQGVVTNAASIDKHHVFYYLDEHRIGDVGNDGPLQISYAEDLASDKTSSGPDAHKKWTPISSADFDQNYDSINSSYPPATSSLYTVRSGDTLSSIALTVWGDASLWYLIADANGLSGNSTLTAGQTLTIPNKVANVHNSYQTYKVYDPGEAIGNTAPTLPTAPPPPQRDGDGCGGFGVFLVMVVVVVVAAYTEQWWLLDDAGEEGAAAGAEGAAAGDFAAPASSIVDAGALPASSYIAAGAVGAAAGNIAGQLVANALNMQRGFNYKSLLTDTAIGAIGGAFGQGGLAQNALGVNNQVAQRFVNGALNDAISQEFKLITKQQSKFDWHSVAVGALAGVAEGAIKDSIGGTTWAKQNPVDAGGAISLASGIASGAIRHGITGQKIDYASIAGEAVGTVLGGSLIADLRDTAAMQQQSTLRDTEQNMGLSVARPYGVGLDPTNPYGVGLRGPDGIRASNETAAQDAGPDGVTVFPYVKIPPPEEQPLPYFPPQFVSARPPDARDNWESFYGDPNLQYVIGHTMTGQFAVRPFMSLVGSIWAQFSSDSYDPSRMKTLNLTELRDDRINLVINAGTLPLGTEVISAEGTAARAEIAAVREAAVARSSVDTQAVSRPDVLATQEAAAAQSATSNAVRGVTAEGMGAGDGYDFAVGLARHQVTGDATLLNNFADRVGAKTYADVYGSWGFRDIPDLANKSLTAMENAERLHINLDGVVNSPEELPTIVQRGSRGIGVQDLLPDGRVSGNVTNWEIFKIETTPTLKAKATYYWNGKPL
jgi:YD repeat-containing protein